MPGCAYQMDKIPVRHINVAQKEPELSESFSIRDVEEMLAGNDMVQELHRHDFFFILALKKGKGEHDIDFVPYTVADHTIFFMRPGQVHRLILKAGSKGYLLQFSADFYTPQHKLLRKNGNANYYRPDEGRFQKILSALTGVFEEYTAKQEGYLEVIKAQLDIFFIGLAREHGSHADDQADLYTQQQLDAFLGLLETHIFEQKEVAQYAAMLSLSLYQLNAITKATLGKTCSELINQRIILEAKRYLLATPNQVNQIAWHLGYEDVSYFIRFFKKHTGHSPEVFRHNFR